MRIDEMIINKKKALDCWANSPCQKTKKSMENMHNYIIILECKGLKTDNRECMCMGFYDSIVLVQFP